MDKWILDAGLGKGEDKRVQILSKLHPVLIGLQDPRWKSIIEHADIVRFPRGMVVPDFYNPGNTCKILLKGIIRVIQVADNGRQLTLFRIFPSDLCFLGLSSLVTSTQLAVIAETKTEIHALAIPRGEYEALIDQSTIFRDYILMTATQRIFQLIQSINTHSFVSLRKKLAQLLLMHFKELSTDAIKITHQELASEFGVTRESINRILQEMEINDCVRLTRGYINLVNKGALQDFV